MKIGDRVKYVGKESGVGYPFSGETGIVTDLMPKSGIVRVRLKDGAQIQLPTDRFRLAPIAVPIIGYSVLAMVTLVAIARIIRR